jgi:hypothetical protein
MPKTLKITTLARRIRRFKSRGGSLLPPSVVEGLKSCSSEIWIGKITEGAERGGTTLRRYRSGRRERLKNLRDGQRKKEQYNDARRGSP